MMRLDEAKLDIKSFFRPLLDWAKEYSEILGFDDKDIKEALNLDIALFNDLPELWHSLCLRVVRQNRILDIVKNNELPDEAFSKLKKISNPKFNAPNGNYDRFIDNMRHYSGIEDNSIQNYNPKNKSPVEVLADLEALEKKYRKRLEDSERFLRLQEDDKIIKTMSNGFVWVMLGRGYCSAEAKAMGHCGNVNAVSSERILSLRQAKKIDGEIFYAPFATFIYDVETKKLGEMKGRFNDKPSDELHPYIITLLKDTNLIKGFRYNSTAHYKPENDFSLDDLSKEEQESLLKANPFLQVRNGVELKTLPDAVLDTLHLPTEYTYAGQTEYRFNREKTRLEFLFPLKMLISDSLKKFIDDDSLRTEEDYLSPVERIESIILSKENLGILYDYLNEEIPEDYETEYLDLTTRESFIKLHRSGFSRDEALELEEIAPQVFEDLDYVAIDAYQLATERVFISNLKRQLNYVDIENFNTRIKLEFDGFFVNGKEVDYFEDSNTKTKWHSTEYFDPSIDDDYQFADEVEEIDFMNPIISRETFDETFKNHFKDLKAFESAPPSSEAENWIKKVKPEFKKKYGADWEKVLYATAWKKFGKIPLKEHNDPSPYVNKWKAKGHDIQVSDYVPLDGNKTGNKFVVNGITILEPTEGDYHVGDRSFDSFDDTMNFLIADSENDTYVSENSDLETMKKLAGIRDPLWKAGGIPYYFKDDKLYVALVIPTHPAYGGIKPQIAKGTGQGKYSKEKALELAKKEVSEETGIEVGSSPVTFIANLSVVSTYDGQHSMTVFAFDVGEEKALNPDWEVTAKWYDFDEVADKIRIQQQPFVEIFREKIDSLKSRN